MRIPLFFIATFWLAAYAPAWATPEFAEQTGQECGVCHLNPGEPELTGTGKSFRNAGFRWPVNGAQKPPLRMGGIARAIVGFLHMATSFAWFGTIIYVHLILKPAYASKGLPRPEVRLGVISMFVVGITGLLLTLSRVDSLNTMFHTRWGLLLTAKITVFLIMVSSAAYVVLYLSKHLKNPRPRAEPPSDGIFGPERLSAFDGKEGRPAFFAYRGKVYDASGLSKWKGGKHFRHLAGEDLTEELANAPHGEEKLSELEMKGEFNPGKGPELTPPQKQFHFLAYMNLALVFVVLAILTMWRWSA